MEIIDGIRHNRALVQSDRVQSEWQTLRMIRDFYDSRVNQMSCFD